MGSERADTLFEGMTVPGFDADARRALEQDVDSVLKDPRTVESNSTLLLRGVGIEPSLETILSYITGMITGRVHAIYRTKYNRELNRDEARELIDLLRRRAWEIRQAFIAARIEK